MGTKLEPASEIYKYQPLLQCPFLQANVYHAFCLVTDIYVSRHARFYVSTLMLVHTETIIGFLNMILIHKTMRRL
jgi:hypothetical protein